MISMQDCLGFCDLDENEVLAIAEHEHIPDIAATALANYLVNQPHGDEAIRAMIVDDIRKALDDGRIEHAAELFMALRGPDSFPSRPPGRSLQAGRRVCWKFCNRPAVGLSIRGSR